MRRLFLPLLMLFSLAACVAPASIMESDPSTQLQLRQMQTRYFDTDDRRMTLQAVMATLQDLGFVIDKASHDLGAISATKLSGYNIRMTVNVVPRGGDKMMVRANAQLGINPILEPAPYQQFFDALSQSLFLEAHLEE